MLASICIDGPNQPALDSSVPKRLSPNNSIKLIKLMLPLLVILSVPCARGEVIVYRLKQTGKFIGASNEFALRGAGFILVDPDTKQGYTIQTATVLGTKFFTTTTFTNTRIYNIIGAKGKPTRHLRPVPSGQTATELSFRVGKTRRSLSRRRGRSVFPGSLPEQGVR